MAIALLALFITALGLFSLLIVTKKSLSIIASIDTGDNDNAIIHGLQLSKKTTLRCITVLYYSILYRVAAHYVALYYTRLYYYFAAL